MQNSDKKTPEILAPAGNIDALKCAVNNGADAVYLGLQNFNARSKATNFSNEQLMQAVSYAHFFGVKVYVTFNTIYKPEEYKSVLESINYCHKIGVDAIILQDFALISLIKSTTPDIVLHLSTQAGVHNAEGAVVAEKAGFSRVILSRETLLPDVRKIKKSTSDLEIETFVQGALCVSFSGNCYFSSIVSGYSGNRGKCMQLCRKKYVYKNKTAYWLSPKDICLADKTTQLTEAGVCSFKIEGRMRRAEYSGEAVNCFRTVLTKNKYNTGRLKRLFNRGDFTDLYIDNPYNDVMFPASQNHIGDRCGLVVSISKNSATISCPLKKGDGIKFMRNCTEVGSALVAKDGVTTTFAGNVKPGDDVRITTDKSLNNEILSKKRYVSFDLSVRIANNRADFTLTSNNTRISVSKENLQNAQTQPLTTNDIFECFSKTEDFRLKLLNSEIIIEQNVFIPKSELNGIRREACSLLRDKIVADYVVKKGNGQYIDVFRQADYFTSPSKCIILQTDSVDCAELCSDYCDYVAYFPRDWSKDVISDLSRLTKPFLLVLPNVIRGKDADLIKKCLNSPLIENVIINNLSGLKFASGKKILLGPFMNIINSDFPAAKILSVEAKNTNPDNFVFYYGNLPLMTFCHCPLRTYSGKCLDCKTCYTDELLDEYGNKFSIYSYRLNYCYAYLLNGQHINLTSINVKTQKKFVNLIGCDKEMCYNIMEKIHSGKKIEGGTLAFYNKELN